MPRTWLPAVLLLSACGAPPAPPERIVLVVVDTLRRDHVGVYGASQPTPGFDRLAEGGTVFRNAVSSFHSTPASMGALFTGRTPSLEAAGDDRALPWNERSWCGLARFAAADEKACIPSAVPTLAERLHGWAIARSPCTPIRCCDDRAASSAASSDGWRSAAGAPTWPSAAGIRRDSRPRGPARW